ncbi:MAG TPA: glutamate racemase [Bauldia sp.]|nr:glutamate racemase [Bauldia sp.]
MSRLLVFDSGIGGLSVAAEIRREHPGAEITYVADDAGFPYGEWEDAALADRVVGLIADLIGEHRPDAVVIACNTASTLVLPPLRARFDIPFVGTVPAIKPAAERTRSGVVAVLGTYGTIRRDYTRGLIESFARECHVRLVGSGNLAPYAERHMRGEAIDDAAIAAEIAPAFIEQGGRRTDIVVLACTHYPFLLPHFERLAPWPVDWIDPAPAIARRVADVSGSASRGGAGGGSAMLTSGKPWPPALAPLLARLALAPVEARADGAP